ncbi:GNAT family N-acetyltransferase [Micromonospora sp. CPCC 206061]|uniref:GNAT family N-acetyltransferase n=1 Tax=Micromonospora sp. CPCC 206061 TaxID=3122410 RepID=UPI002FF3AD3D
MTVVIRAGAEDDLTAVGELHFRSRLAAYSRFVPHDALTAMPPSAMVDYWVERWRYERGDHQLTVAEADGAVVGFTYLGPDEEPDTGILNAIHVDPDLVGSGVGRVLMRDALAKLSAGGWRRAVLWVLTANTRARRFYERGGWAPDGVEREDHIGTAPVRHMRYVLPLPGDWPGEST